MAKHIKKPTVIDTRTQQLIQQKAESGQKLAVVTPEKQKLYDFYQNRAKNTIMEKAATGTALSSPNPWKQSIYDQARKAQTPKYTPQPSQPLPDRKAQTPKYTPQPSQPLPDMNKTITDMQSQMQGYLNNMYNQQKESQLSQLRASRDKAIGQINQQKANVSPEYADKRNQADVVNTQNVQRLRELMAANGLQSSGENVSATVAANNQRLNSLNSLNMQEQQTINDYDRRIADLNNPNDENAMMASLESERSRALFDAYNRAQDIGYGRYRDAVGDQRYVDETTYSRFRDSVDDRNYLDDRNYNRQRDAISDQRYDQEFNYQKQRDRQSDDWRRYAYQNMSAAEKAQLEWAKRQYGEDAAWRMYEMEYNGELAKSTSAAELAAYTSGFNNVSEGGGYNNYFKTNQLAGSMTPNSSAKFQNFQNQMKQAVQMGVPQSWVTGMTELIGRESSWNPNAKNPNSTAFGYGQFLNSTRQTYEKKTGLDYSKPVNQIVMMAQYVKDRYGTPDKALAFWDANKWYLSPLVASISGLLESLFSFNLL